MTLAISPLVGLDGSSAMQGDCQAHMAEQQKTVQQLQNFFRSDTQALKLLCSIAIKEHYMMAAKRQSTLLISAAYVRLWTQRKTH